MNNFIEKLFLNYTELVQLYYAPVAQWIEYWFPKPGVGCSSHLRGAKFQFSFHPALPPHLKHLLVLKISSQSPSVAT
jgi:hypothetical protein